MMKGHHHSINNLEMRDDEGTPSQHPPLGDEG